MPERRLASTNEPELSRTYPSPASTRHRGLRDRAYLLRHRRAPHAERQWRCDHDARQGHRRLPRSDKTWTPVSGSFELDLPESACADRRRDGRQQVLSRRRGSRAHPRRPPCSCLRTLLSSSRLLMGPMRTRCHTSVSTATRCTLASTPCSAELRAHAVGVRFVAVRTRLQHVHAGAFDLRGGRQVALDVLVLLRHHDLEVRQHLVEVVLLGGLGGARAARSRRPPRATRCGSGCGASRRFRELVRRAANIDEREAGHHHAGSARRSRTHAAARIQRAPLRGPCSRGWSASPCSAAQARDAVPRLTCSPAPTRPSSVEPVAQHLLHAQHQRQARVAQRGVLDDELLGVVVGVEHVGELAQVVHQGVRRAVDARPARRSPGSG